MTLLPEWHPQWGVLLCWPDQHTDWHSALAEAEQCYTTLARHILERENLLLICRDDDHEAHVRALLMHAGAELERLHCVHAPFDDTWARDFGPLVVQDGDALLALDFTFNGWGGKFDAAQDNALTRQLPLRIPVHTVALVLEGGSVESNGDGLLLTTRHCLMNPNRNPSLDQAGIEQALNEHLGARQVLWLNHGDLEGDDTDAHIDTLARFCSRDTIAYVRCDDPADSHFRPLQEMAAELETLAQAHQLTLVPLPMASACHHPTDGHRLPATYANFLIINGAVLVPTYDCETDSEALVALTRAFPDRQVIGVPCGALIAQHGSLHCVTMQLPEGVL